MEQVTYHGLNVVELCFKLLFAHALHRLWRVLFHASCIIEGFHELWQGHNLVNMESFVPFLQCCPLLFIELVTTLLKDGSDLPPVSVTDDGRRNTDVDAVLCRWLVGGKVTG